MYVPHTEADRQAMLAAIGAESLEALFADVPAAKRFPDLNLPAALTEMEALGELKTIAAANGTPSGSTPGGGSNPGGSNPGGGTTPGGGSAPGGSATIAAGTGY